MKWTLQNRAYYSTDGLTKIMQRWEGREWDVSMWDASDDEWCWDVTVPTLRDAKEYVLERVVA